MITFIFLYIFIWPFFNCVSGRYLSDIKCRHICARDFDICLNSNMSFIDIFLCFDSKERCMAYCQGVVVKAKKDTTEGYNEVKIIEH